MREDLLTARKTGDRDRVSLLKTLVAAIENAAAIDPAGLEGITEAPRRLLTEGDVRRVLEWERGELLRAAAEYEGRGGTAEATRLRGMANQVDAYLE